MVSDAEAREPASRNPLARLLVAQPGELPAVLVGMLLFFLLFASWFMLRPVRETFGIAGGVENLQWLFTGTFVGTLVAVPLYGWAARRVPRRRLVPGQGPEPGSAREPGRPIPSSERAPARQVLPSPKRWRAWRRCWRWWSEPLLRRPRWRF